MLKQCYSDESMNGSLSSAENVTLKIKSGILLWNPLRIGISNIAQCLQDCNFSS